MELDFDSMFLFMATGHIMGVVFACPYKPSKKTNPFCEFQKLNTSKANFSVRTNLDRNKFWVPDFLLGCKIIELTYFLGLSWKKIDL